MTEIVIHEVGLRDGLQMEQQVVSTEQKVRWIESLLESGVDIIQLGSFVHPLKVPQMADTDELFKRVPASAKASGKRPVLSALVLNDRGLDRGLAVDVEMFCMGVSASETHSRKNTGRSVVEATEQIICMAQRALGADKRVQVSVQSAFGCGYEGPVPESRVMGIVRRFLDGGIRAISLADTAGHAVPDRVEALFGAILDAGDDLECACHFHDTYGLALANTYAALREATCARRTWSTTCSRPEPGATSISTGSSPWQRTSEPSLGARWRGRSTRPEPWGRPQRHVRERPMRAGKLLSGIRVLDLTNVLSGPFATLHLALSGAEVIKVENPSGGDLARKLGCVPKLNKELMGTSFLAQNANKKSLTLNLKHEEGRKLFRKLAATADVLVENFRPGVTARLGLSYESLRESNPGLIYCAISGFGQTGPDAMKPAYDQIIQGLSGCMGINGDERLNPLRAGFPVCDTVGGLNAAFAIMGALFHRERTGEGQLIDVALLSSWGTTTSPRLPRGPSPPRTATSTSRPTSKSSGRR